MNKSCFLTQICWGVHRITPTSLTSCLTKFQHNLRINFFLDYLWIFILNFWFLRWILFIIFLINFQSLGFTVDFGFLDSLLIFRFRKSIWTRAWAIVSSFPWLSCWSWRSRSLSRRNRRTRRSRRPTCWRPSASGKPRWIPTRRTGRNCTTLLSY